MLGISYFLTIFNLFIGSGWIGVGCCVKNLCLRFFLRLSYVFFLVFFNFFIFFNCFYLIGGQNVWVVVLMNFVTIFFSAV